MVIFLIVPVTYYALFLIYHTIKFIKYQPKYRKNLLFTSIIIPVRNESKNIEACLKSIIKQEYPKDFMEIIVVNDHSEDETKQKLLFFEQFSFIKILDLPKEKQGKKESIAWGIAHAKGEIILTTDGDTIRGNHWLETLIGYFDNDTAMVSGPVKLTGTNIWQKMQALEFSGLILLGAAMIANKRPSLCNGANLAYRKKVFEEVKGFQNIDHIASGDDELLLHKIRKLKKYSIVFAKNQKAIVETNAHKNIKKFVNQRLRWASKSTIYPDKWITFHLIMAYLANLAIPISIFFDYPIIFLLLGIKIIAEWISLKVATTFLQQNHILRWLWIEQMFHIIYVLWVGCASQFKNSYEWKGRKLK